MQAPAPPPACRPVRALLGQLAPQPADLAANARRAAEVIRANAGADLVVLPELFLCGYDLATVRDLAVTPDGPELAAVREAAAAARTAVLVGIAEDRGDAIANALVAIDVDGDTAGVARKVQLFGDEAAVLDAGDELSVVELGGHRIGAMICFDMEFPECARALALAGADLLVTASANMAPFHADHLLASRARALDNRLAHLYVNRVGAEAGLRFVGGSRAIASDGTVMADAGQDDERLLEVEVPRDEAGDERTAYLALLREDLRAVPARPLAAPASGGHHDKARERHG
jgi:predicted amidohydrolase